MKKLNVFSNSNITKKKHAEKIIIVLIIFIITKRNIFNTLILKIAFIFIMKSLINLLNNSRQ